jgi:transposase, IS30 family
MKYKHLSILEREKIQELFWQKKSIRYISKVIHRSPSSISRELTRNFPAKRPRYTPRLANERALFKRTCRGRTERLKTYALRAYVVNQLKQGWSPAQISAVARKENIGHISHEAIYQFVYAQIHRSGHGYVKPGHEDLRMYLRRKQKRRQRKGMRKSQRIFRPKGVSIDERPQIVDARKRIGDWEGDTVESCNHKPGVNTLLERKTGLFLITRLRDKTSMATVHAMEKRMTCIPTTMKKTITLDNGPENSDWQTIEKETELQTFFAHPYHSWERGANENANGLLREYFPKGTDFSTISDDELAEVEYRLNSRPRKRLDWLSPLQAVSVALGG